MESQSPNPATRRVIIKFCRQRCATVLPSNEVSKLEAYLLGLIAEGRNPPLAGKAISWRRVAVELGLDAEWTVATSHVFRPAFELVRSEAALRPKRPATAERARASVRSLPDTKVAQTAVVSAPERPPSPPKRTYRRKRGVAVLPEIQDVWADPDSFHEALALHMHRYGETSGDRWRGIVRPGESLETSTLIAWRRGSKVPRGVASMGHLARIERRYHVLAGYFSAKLPHPSRAATGHHLLGIPASEQRWLAWHLPDDFAQRGAVEREEILEWIQRVIISGSTDYRRYQAAASKLRYAVRFPALQSRARLRKPMEDPLPEDEDPDLAASTIRAPARLDTEMNELVQFKTANLTPLGYQRRGAWNAETASQKVEHLGLERDPSG
ncbi:MAG: hypothetical protein CGW95_15590, partial [Phenylobacterium zucineum]